MANAAFTSLAAQASITLINNKGDIGKTLRDLGRSSTVKNMIVAAGVAGVNSYTDAWGTTLTNNGNRIVTDWSQRSQAYLLNTAAKGVLTGTSSSSDWWTVAGLGRAGEAYQCWGGRGADPRPGVERPGGLVFKPVEEGGIFRVPRETVDGLLREGKNVGYNEPCTSLLAVCHGTPISNALNTLPGFNAFATLHDGWGAWLEKGEHWNLATNLGSMPPALLVTYVSLLDPYRYLAVQRSAPLTVAPAPPTDGRVRLLPRPGRACAF
jgi:filamentous hemagglutinin